jgi:hypothetical protein
VVCLLLRGSVSVAYKIPFCVHKIEGLEHPSCICESSNDHQDMEDLVTCTHYIKLSPKPSFRDLVVVSQLFHTPT